MILTNQSFEIINQYENIKETSSKEEILDSINRHIELAGRTCYKSLDKVTEDSSKPFVERLIRSKHLAMLEQATVYLYYTYSSPLEDDEYMEHLGTLVRYSQNPYSKVYEEEIIKGFSRAVYITTNYRVIIENQWEDDLKYMCSPKEKHIKRHTVKVITNLQVSHEIVRHRKFSYAMESSRYCNYSKDKFGNELTFIKPLWCKEDDKSTMRLYKHLMEAEKTYLGLISEGWKPQEAATVLPKATKTEIVITGFESDWDFFFKLRSDIAQTGNPHPQMVELVNPIRDEFISNGWSKIKLEKSLSE